MKKLVWLTALIVVSFQALAAQGSQSAKGAVMRVCWVSFRQTPQGVSYNLSIWNIGSERAQNVRVFSKAAFSRVEPMDFNHRGEAIAVNESVGDPHPNASNLDKCPGYLGWTTPQPNLQDRSFVYVYGSIWYTDLTGSHESQFCFYRKPVWPAEALNSCMKHNKQ